MSGARDHAAAARAQCEWGLYWAHCARLFPEHARACAHNEVMNALHAMALETLQQPEGH